MENLRVTELDFLSIKENLKQFLRNQNTFKDYNFDGSAMSVLLDVLAYNTHYLAFYNNMIANEMFLDTAQLPESVASHTKQLNYMLSSRKAASANVNVMVTPSPTFTDSVLTLDKHQVFQAKSLDGVNYFFTTLTAYTTFLENGKFTFKNVEIRQGLMKYVQYVYFADTNPASEFVLADDNIDTDTIEVRVQNSLSNNSTWTATQASDATVLDGSASVYFLYAEGENTYKIKFGDGYIGRSLANGNVVLVSYLKTEGDSANQIELFSTGRVGNQSSVFVQTNAPSSGGAERETPDSARYRAPLAYTTQNRMVTVQDYQQMIQKMYPNIRNLVVWGGEEQTPPVYGKIFISYLTKPGVYINETEKQRIIDDIIRPSSVINITPEFVDPSFVYLLISTLAEYDAGLTQLSTEELTTAARSAVNTYINTELNKFTAIFVTSKLEREIDDSNPAILGNHTEVRLQKRFKPILNEKRNYTIHFGFPIKRGSATEQIKSTEFYVYDTTHIKRLAMFGEIPLSSTGIDGIEIVNPGFSYVEAPEVIITGDGVGAEAIAYIANGRLTRIEMVKRGIGYTRATISFSGGQGAGARATPQISQLYGNLELFYYESAGKKVVLNDNAGSVDYQKGQIELFAFKPVGVDATDNVIRVSVSPDTGIMEAQQNQIFVLDTTDPTSLLVTVKAHV